MCSHYLRASCDFFYGASEIVQSAATRGKSIQKLCNCTVGAMSVQLPCSLRILRTGNCTEPVRKSAFARCNRAGIVQCHLRHVYGLWAYNFFKFVKLLAKPNRRGRGARESVLKISQPPPASARRPRGGRTERGIRAGYGLRRPIASQGFACVKLGISDDLRNTPIKMLK